MDTDTETPTGREKIAKAANNAILVLVARWSMVMVVPFLTVAAGVAGYAANRVITTIDAAALSIVSVNLKLTAIEGTTALLSSQQADTNRTMNSRFDAQGRRIDRNDIDIDDLKKRVYPLTRTP